MPAMASTRPPARSSSRSISRRLSSARADGSYPHGYVYSRNHNPNRNGLEAALAALEGGAVAAAFGSGLAAVTAIFQGLQPGDHVVAPNDIYHGTANVLKHLFAKWQVARPSST